MKCLNRGQCTLDRNREAFCVCEDGFDGKFCEININECASNPCFNNGTCVDGVNRYHCVCMDKYIDKTCRDLDAPNPCKKASNDTTNARFNHPFTKEKYLVCSVEGFAQVLSCPEGLVWSQIEQLCVPIDSRSIFDMYASACRIKEPNAKLEYKYSKLKYVHCNNNAIFSIETCQLSTPYYCASINKCVDKYDDSCIASF